MSSRERSRVADTALAAPVAASTRRRRRRATLVIFGASGDLTRRLLIPSLCHLRRGRLLSEHFALVGVARAAMDDAAFRKTIGESVARFAGAEVRREDGEWLAAHSHYVAGELNDPAAYQRLAAGLTRDADAYGTGGNAIFYLAIPAERSSQPSPRVWRVPAARAEGGRVAPVDHREAVRARPRIGAGLEPPAAQS